ncbi:MAG: ATP-binding protein [Lachnospiraceae bacterium]|nr:ATP-binding protein [Lachnospiraceae bacterium]
MERDSIYKEIGKRLDGLYIYNNIKENEIIKALYALCEEGGKNQRSFVQKLIFEAEKEGLSGNIYKDLIIKIFLQDENYFTLALERKENIGNKSILQFAHKDMEAIYYILSIPPEFFLGSDGEYIKDYKSLEESNLNFLEGINAQSFDEFFESTADYYMEKGCGDLAVYPAFRYNSAAKNLEPVENFDKVYFDEIIGCEYQKKQLKSNTEAFLEGFRANNVLLAGSRGTGKSSCIKALSTEYYARGLRIIEIKKEQIMELSRILKLIEKRGKYFIIFVDDLSFEDFEIEYKHMKSLLEGSTQARPKNVLFYATSNRRHIIQEKWKDKITDPDDEEVHTSDMMNEKLSLSDRFGLTLTFGRPSPDEFVNIVEGIARLEGMDISREELSKRAFQWELTHKGLSGRTARQFIDNLLWEKNANQ